MPRRKPGALLDRELRILRDLAQNGPRHGLAIADDLENPTRTVYNALQRLEEMGYVESSWQTSNVRTKKPRRIYRLTDKGRRTASMRS